MVNVVSDHANSNTLFYEVSRFYKLHEHGQFLPRRDSKQLPKAVADLFEAWIGLAITSRLLFDINDPLVDLQEFFYRFYSLRYSQLRRYAFSAPSEIPHVPDHSLQDCQIYDVYLGNDPLLDSNILSSRPGQYLGSLVTIKFKPSSFHHHRRPRHHHEYDEPPPLTAFSTTKEEALKMSALTLWSGPRHLP